MRADWKEECGGFLIDRKWQSVPDGCTSEIKGAGVSQV